MITEALTDSSYIGSYRITGFLGKGNFGVVYQAYQPFLERKVAIKVIPTDLLTGDYTEPQFMQEARTIAKLRHPNIVNVYEFGTGQHNNQTVTYMVMEHLPGETLQSLLKIKQLSVEEVLDITDQLASALDYAHSHNIVHRDLKPANIMFSEQNEPVMVDFGLAKLIEISSNREKPVTPNPLESDSTGTPAYMSPEQALGKNATPASDQYSLALIVYEMLAKQLPFSGKSLHEILAAKIGKSPIPLTEVAPQYPHAASMVLQRVFLADPEARFPTATAFANALDEALAPDRRVRGVVTVSDPVQAEQLRSARQTVLGFMYGLVLVTAIIALFCTSLFLRGYVNGDATFIWDGIVSSTTIDNGYHDVIGLWPDGPAEQAGVQIGDRIRTDIFNDIGVKEGDFSVNGQPRSSYPVNWQPQDGDVVTREVMRNGQPVAITYTLERSVYSLLVLLVQLPAAVLAFFCALWVLRRWGAVPTVFIFTMVLMAASFTVVASGVSNVIANIDGTAEYLLLPLLLHLVLVFPEPLRYIKEHPQRVWWLYLPVPFGLIQFLTALPFFDRFNIAVYAVYAVLIAAAVIFKWGRRDLKRYPELRILLIGCILAIFTVMLSEAIIAFDDYGTVQTLWGGNGLTMLAVDYTITTLGASIAILLGTIGLHRVQLSLGHSIPANLIPNDPPDIFKTLAIH